MNRTLGNTAANGWTVPAGLAAMVLAAAVGPAAAVDLTVEVTNVRSSQGNVHVSVYNKPETFPTGSGMHAEVVVEAKENGIEVVFPDLEPGTYAVAAFHDENENGDFDQGFLGLPLEDFAFSNDAKVVFSAPDFEEAAFTVDGATAAIKIRMKR